MVRASVETHLGKHCNPPELCRGPGLDRLEHIQAEEGRSPLVVADKPRYMGGVEKRDRGQMNERRMHLDALGHWSWKREIAGQNMLDLRGPLSRCRGERKGVVVRIERSEVDEITVLTE